MNKSKKGIYNNSFNKNKILCDSEKSNEEKFENNKIEYINYSSEKKNKSNNIKNDSERKNDEYINGNEMIGNKKQQPIYYRSSREKEKKKLTFNKWNNIIWFDFILN